MKWLWAVRWRRWVIVVGFVVGAAGGWYGYHHEITAPYTSSSQVLINGRFSDNQVDSAYTADQYVDQRMSTYAEIASSEQVAGPAAKVVGVDAGTLGGDTTATVQTDTTVITLAVTGTSPQAAYANATAVTNSFVTAITALETTPGSEPRVALSVITDPGVPPARVLPVLPVWIIGGALLVPILALLIAELVRWLYPRWTTPGEDRPARRTVVPARPEPIKAEPPPASGQPPKPMPPPAPARPVRPPAAPPTTQSAENGTRKVEREDETARLGPVPEPPRWPAPTQSTQPAPPNPSTRGTARPSR
ncbi:MAG TPA: hypothetical protein VG317_17420 [Pseudonocardiaceae bacterium]|jgi:capsular polysaccharide biosynthesis protein|nr:hypothetical protein [Pseudonocardiaceae bacterium]